ncbi:MAG: RidA family protein [Verrucomicrobiota bacterium]|nr:RidA family protein [Verrucomicrobiota bacterium]
MKSIISTDLAPKAIGPYSQAVRSGDFLFCSGQIPLDPKTGELASPEIRGQVRQVLENVKGLVSSQGLSLENVVKTTVFLTDLSNFAIMNEIYGNYFDKAPPARTTIQVSRLPKDSLVEIEVIAAY